MQRTSSIRGVSDHGFYRLTEDVADIFKSGKRSCLGVKQHSSHRTGCLLLWHTELDKRPNSLDVSNCLLLYGYCVAICVSCWLLNPCSKDVVLWLMPTSNLPGAISLQASQRNHCGHYNLKQNTVMPPMYMLDTALPFCSYLSKLLYQ